MTRHTVNTITSDALDALYEQLEAAEDSEAQRQLATAREALASAATRAARAEHELAALRQVARGYCPACGRGDAAPTVTDWERERQRAEEAEGHLAHLQESSEAVGRFLTRTVDERDQLRAAIRRVRDYAADIERSSWTGPAIARRIRAALDEPAASPAATQATDTTKEN
ncbi:hypothetical protein [Streptomyces sp. LUP30]|uniref:hypothetical protein n=2 Tax=unclassified Streptomyces TaxID=2593676 RepID=UPI00085185C2|nr:hypothetical protein [Streptomyces sp. LUP30]